MDGPIRVFVYGTLMPDEARWPALAPYAAAWQSATALGRIWDTGHGYPAVQFGGTGEGDDGPVPGVAVTLHPDRATEALAILDGIEEEGALYRRVAVATSVGDAFAYEWLGGTDGLVALPDGWLGRP